MPCRGFQFEDCLELQSGAVVRKNEEPSLSYLLHQAVFVVQAGEHRLLLDAMTGWQLVPVVGERYFVLGGLREART